MLLEVCLARTLALLAVLVEVSTLLFVLELMKFDDDLLGDVGSDGGGVCNPEVGEFVARAISGSLHLSRKAFVMLCLYLWLVPSSCWPGAKFCSGEETSGQ